MDHFAKPGDELAKAQRQGTLRRNFMGYTTQAGSDLLAFGVSSISGLNGFYAQNQRKISDYYDAVDADNLATMRGYALNEDDLLRRHIIMQLLCHGSLNFAEVETHFGLPSFAQYFEKALSQLAGFVEDGLAQVNDDGILLTPVGRILSRNVAMKFDAYLPENQGSPIFSKTI
jgi:oxygen-independent coproporphyrinogen-3 oxidase